jgi:membrane protease YdiL (CAAX protease family)
MWQMQVFNISDFSHNKMGKKLFLICIGISFAIVAFLFIFTQLPDNRFISPSPTDFIIVAFAQLFGVGILEEVLFRGLILKILLIKMRHSKKGIVNACVISSILFGVSHVGNIIYIAIDAVQLSVYVVLPVVSQIIFTTAFGILAVALFLRSGTLWIPILVHGVGNLIVQTFVAFVSRERIFQFVQTPIEMSIPEFFASTLISALPLLGAGLFLLRKVYPDEITGSR